MPRIYCPSCGSANEHSGVKPKFCGFCSEALSLDGSADEAFASEPVPTRRHKPTISSQTVNSRRNHRVAVGRRSIYDEDDGAEMMTDGTLPDLDKIEIEVSDMPDLSKNAPRLKVGDIWAATPGVIENLRPTPKVGNKKEAVASFFREKVYKKANLDTAPTIGE